jgi:polysaccharide deacetylase family protein (PEP-CTERM system associated)
MTEALLPRLDSPAPALGQPIILSFDVEDHHVIEAAAGLTVSPALQAIYQQRVVPVTSWLLEQLHEHAIQATFFLVGELARRQPALVRAIHGAGHEIASHGWGHQRVHNLSPASFREDLRRTKDTLEQLTGAGVAGFRAPTFSIVHETRWAIDVLVEAGIRYDSSIYPVRHDRYGIPHAPRVPFLVRGGSHTLLELPPLTLRLLRANLPIGGGGYFRLLPLRVMDRAVRQLRRNCQPPVAMLYFHPWEFDAGQPRLALKGLSRFRTYVGMNRSRARLQTLLGKYRFARAVDVVDHLDPCRPFLPILNLATN